MLDVLCYDWVDWMIVTLHMIGKDLSQVVLQVSARLMCLVYVLVWLKSWYEIQ